MEPGARVGCYEVRGPLGSGQMGEVYRAHDTRLGRDVALKILPAALARDPDRLARFEREARLLASLNHPNVAAIYDIEDGGESLALVLELVEGETLQVVLRSRKARSEPLSVEEALDFARQIASALDATHERGIVHRDLKPANVKLTPGGVVKVLDFGLGRASARPEEAVTSQAPTLASDSTTPGTVLGTAAYMSPEQARGSAVDKRADIWAFGCVLYELLTGTRPFAGETFSDTIARVIEREPDWDALPGRTPTGVRRLLRRCLEKDVRRRLRDIGDARLDLDEAPDEIEERSRRAERARPDVRLERLTDLVAPVGSPALSPDGKMVAFVAATSGRKQIWVRMLAGGAPLQVTRDDADHDEPRWLPDASALVYHVAGADEDSGGIWQIPALGGPPRYVAAAMGGGDVSHDSRRIALFDRRGGEVVLVVAALDGSTSQAVLTLSPESFYGCPRWSPDDRLVAFQRTGVTLDTSLDVVATASGERRTLVGTQWMRGHAWLPDGSALAYSSSTGSTMPYPPTNNLRVVSPDGSGDRQLTFGDVSYFEPDVDASGRLVATRVRSRSDVWAFPIEGEPAENVRSAVRITRQTGQIQAPSLSPDGREIVYLSDNGGHANLWAAALDGSNLRQLTFERDPGVAIGVPAWSPRGRRVAFVRAHDARIDICLINSDGSRFGTLLTDAFAFCWSGDGRWMHCSRPGWRIDKVNVETGDVVRVREDRATSPALVPRDGAPLYFTRLPESAFGCAGGEYEICRARPEDGPAEVLARLPTSRVPLAPRISLQAFLSPDGRWLAAPLFDGWTTNIWFIPTDGSPMRAVTDFGERAVSIARSMSWSPDSHLVYAAVADTDADIVAISGLLG
jgi:Tol biopolymer transport system component